MSSALFEKYITTKTKADEEEIRFATTGSYFKREKKRTMTDREYDLKIREAIMLAKRRK